MSTREMEALIERIEARSRVEAMDWSLALISQGIESTIERTDEAGWGLLVSAQDHTAALEVIGLYQKENRRWIWRHDFLQPGLVFDWVSFAWVILLVALYWLNFARIDLRTPGVLDTVALARGQWWRLFTAIWLHADLAHLASNATFGFVLLGLTMGRYGTGVGLIAAYVAGAGGNLFAWIFSAQPHSSLGASGMVMGCVGLLAVQSISIWRRTPRAGRIFLSSLFAGVMLFVLLGLTPGTDVVAHFGGFLCGLALGGVMEPFARLLRKPKANVICGLVFLALVLWPWWLAIRRGI
jgi:rhomboid protease GluP